MAACNSRVLIRSLFCAFSKALRRKACSMVTICLMIQLTVYGPHFDNSWRPCSVQYTLVTAFMGEEHPGYLQLGAALHVSVAGCAGGFLCCCDMSRVERRPGGRCGGLPRVRKIVNCDVVTTLSLVSEKNVVTTEWSEIYFHQTLARLENIFFLLTQKREP